jgi:hypothetical protein
LFHLVLLVGVPSQPAQQQQPVSLKLRSGRRGRQQQATKNSVARRQQLRRAGERGEEKSEEEKEEEEEEEEEEDEDDDESSATKPRRLQYAATWHRVQVSKAFAGNSLTAWATKILPRFVALGGAAWFEQIPEYKGP